jgi:hypothetical protein
MAKKTKKPAGELQYEGLVPLVKDKLVGLNACGWQHIEPEHIDQLAINQAKALAFLKITEKDLADQSFFDYQGTMDCALAMIEQLDDVQKIKFLEAVGRPLTNDEMVRWFFGL